MKDINKIEQAKSMLEKLANGIDPLTNEALDRKCVVCNEDIVSCLEVALEALDEQMDVIRERSGSDRKQGRKAFFITDSQFRKLSLNNGECKVSDIAKEINRVTAENGTNIMQAVWINN